MSQLAVVSAREGKFPPPSRLTSDKHAFSLPPLPHEGVSETETAWQWGYGSGVCFLVAACGWCQWGEACGIWCSAAGSSYRFFHIRCYLFYSLWSTASPMLQLSLFGNYYVAARGGATRRNLLVGPSGRPPPRPPGPRGGRRCRGRWAGLGRRGGGTRSRGGL